MYSTAKSAKKRKFMSDYIAMAMAGNASIRAFGAVTGNLVEEARRRHNTSPVATAALGRMLTAGVLMGSMMKNPTDTLTLQIKCMGSIEGITVTSDSQGHVKGYVNNPNVWLPPKNGKLDVGGALKEGFIRVVKDMGLKEPYSGQTNLQTGEIGDDLSYYFATSEQIPSSVGLGVLMSKDNHVRCAGGFIVQVMPFIQESILNQLEENVKKLSSVTAMLEEEMSPEGLLKKVLEGLDIIFTDTMPASFYCNCSKERIEKVIISLGKKEIQGMIEENEPVEVMCHFCNTAYHYDIDELGKILNEITEKIIKQD
jgi:molecular chaperone Hsp33